MNGRQARNQTFAVLLGLVTLLIALALWFWWTITILGFLAGGAFAIGGRGKPRRRR